MAAGTAPCQQDDAGERLYKEALDWYWGLAAHGVSDTLAVEAFRDAAALGHPAALLQMGAFYKCGRLTGRDADKAEDCFDRAASAGSWFTSRAECGDPLAMWQLSRAIAHGIVAGDAASTAGVPCPVLPDEALRAWETLPAAGREEEADASALEAQSDARVKARALYWCWRAASCGYALAQFDLSQCYHQGEGVPRDAEAAAKWCRLAADAGMTEGAYVLGCYHAEGCGVKQSDAESSAWLRRASACGHLAGQRLLSLMHKRSGCERASSKWLRNARDSSAKPAAVAQQQPPASAAAPPPPVPSSAPSQASQQRQSDTPTPAPASSPQSGGARVALSGPTPPRAHAGPRRPSMLRRSAELAQSAAALMHSR